MSVIDGTDGISGAKEAVGTVASIVVAGKLNVGVNSACMGWPGAQDEKTKLKAKMTISGMLPLIFIPAFHYGKKPFPISLFLNIYLLFKNPRFFQ